MEKANMKKHFTSLVPCRGKREKKKKRVREGGREREREKMRERN